MSEEIKVGDYVFTKSEICAFLVNDVNEDTIDVCQPTGIMTIDKSDCKKVYVSDTPPSKTVPLEEVHKTIFKDKEVAVKYLIDIASDGDKEQTKQALNDVLQGLLPDTPPSGSGSYINVDDLLDYIKPDNGDDYMVSHSELSDQINTFAANNGVSLPEITQT